MMKRNDFEWNEAKREINIKIHRIDFEDVPLVFQGPHVVWPSRRGGEPRYLAIGFLEGREVSVIYTLRDAKRRIISARRARRYEREALQDAIRWIQAKH
jgi:uncharacterized DUF497 family protein